MEREAARHETNRQKSHTSTKVVYVTLRRTTRRPSPCGLELYSILLSIIRSAPTRRIRDALIGANGLCHGLLCGPMRRGQRLLVTERVSGFQAHDLTGHFRYYRICLSEGRSTWYRPFSAWKSRYCVVRGIYRVLYMCAVHPYSNQENKDEPQPPDHYASPITERSSPRAGRSPPDLCAARSASASPPRHC